MTRLTIINYWLLVIVCDPSQPQIYTRYTTMQLTARTLCYPVLYIDTAGTHIRTNLFHLLYCTLAVWINGNQWQRRQNYI